MSETNGNISEPTVVTYLDGHVVTVNRLDRPGILVRLEREHPDVEYGSETVRLKAEWLYWMAWQALRIDLAEGDPYRPGDDFMEWLDRVADVEMPDGPPKLPEPEKARTAPARKPREPQRTR